MRIAALFSRIKGIIPMLKDKEVAWWKKAILILGFIYLILPVDLIPPLVPVFGWLDDFLIWVAILYFMGKELDRYVPERACSNKKYRYKDSDVTEARFTVDDDDVSNEEEIKEEEANEH